MLPVSTRTDLTPTLLMQTCRPVAVNARTILDSHFHGYFYAFISGGNVFWP